MLGRRGGTPGAGALGLVVARALTEAMGGTLRLAGGGGGNHSRDNPSPARPSV